MYPIAGKGVSADNGIMRLTLNLAASFTVLGLISGVAYRELGRYLEVPLTQPTSLATVHTHLLVLGSVVLLIVLALAGSFNIHKLQGYRLAVWVYALGVGWTAAFMAWKGVGQMRDTAFEFSAGLAGASGLGHIILTVGFFMLFRVFYQGLKQKERSEKTPI